MDTKEFIVEFIELYQSFPCLWKVKSQDYSKKDKKNEAYGVLVSKYREVDPTATRDTVVRRIGSLRASFRKEFNKLENSKRSAVVPEDIYKPTLWYFDNLLFLKDQKIPKTGASTLDGTEEDSEDINGGSATTPSSEDGLLDERNSRVIQINSNATPEVNLGSSSFKRIRVLNKEPLTSPVTGHDAHALGGHSCPSAGHLNSSGATPPEAPKEDEHDVFGRHVANELRSLPDDLNRRWARLKIQQVLFDAHSCPKES